MKFYLKATGDACYGQRGITFPVKRKFDFKGDLEILGAKRVKMELQTFDDGTLATNLPRVLAFELSENDKLRELQLRNIRAMLSTARFPLIVRQWETV